jgi:hypothetical protein
MAEKQWITLRKIVKYNNRYFLKIIDNYLFKVQGKWERYVQKWGHLQQNKSGDSSVGIATDYGLDDRMIGVRFPEGNGTGSGAHPASYSMGTRGFFPRIKRPGREADHSLPSSAEVKECVELHPQYAFIVWCSVKAQGQFYLAFTNINN